MTTTRTPSDASLDRRGHAPAIRGRRASRIIPSTIRRFVSADGTSHTRALAYQIFLMVISGFIGLVGLASQLNISQLRRIVERLAVRLAPGPSGRLLTEAVRQGSRSGTTAMVVGLGAALVAGTLAMAQIQRSADRLYGLGRDRAAGQRYGLALLMILSVGVLLALGGLLVAAGESISHGLGWSGGTKTVFDIVRWIVGPLIVLGATWVLFRLAPREGWTSSSAQVVGVVVAVVLWIAFTLALAFDLSTSTSSRTYGPLLSVVGLILWAGLSSLALHLGLATSATVTEGEARSVEAKAAAPA